MKHEKHAHQGGVQAFDNWGLSKADALHAPNSQRLIAAIDDYVEQLTGDRTRLHTQHHSIGR
ncbi:hypothetical protein UP06_03985 [Bradyrhizobium sp. LTSP857]|nr:hypothetical protein UP06_03985 [Bradyrhizobium sp. LTSP857]